MYFLSVVSAAEDQVETCKEIISYFCPLKKFEKKTSASPLWVVVSTRMGYAGLVMVTTIGMFGRKLVTNLKGKGKKKHLQLGELMLNINQFKILFHRKYEE